MRLGKWCRTVLTNKAYFYIQDGCIGCFDGIGLLGKKAISVLFDCVQAVQRALASNSKTCAVGAQEVIRLIF